MSYAIAPTFEGNRIGVRRIGTLSGVGGIQTSLAGLGAVADTAQVLIDNGWDSTLINGLVQAGASDAQLTDLLNGATDPATILTQVKAQQSGAVNLTVAPAPPVSIAQPPQIPSGSTLLYSASWSIGLGSVTVRPISAIAKIQTALPTYGMSVLSGKPLTTGLFGGQIQLTIQVTGWGFSLVRDAQSILDSLLHDIVGSNVTGSNLQVVAGPGQALPGGPSGTSDVTSWLEANWKYLALALGVLVIVPPLIKKL